MNNNKKIFIGVGSNLRGHMSSPNKNIGSLLPDIVV